MAYDHSEQEQLETLKAWWKQYGNLVTWLLTAALVAYAAWTGWNWYQRNQAVQASQLFDTLQKSDAAKDNAKVQRAAADIEDKFGRTAYAPMAALLAARSAFDAGDLKAAKAQLNWVIDNAKGDEHKSLARLRLAAVLLDEKNYDGALQQLAGDFPPAFAALALDRRGDVLTAQNKLAEARTAYQQAIEKTAEKDQSRQLIQLKLDAIGGAPATAAKPDAKAEAKPAA